MGGCELTSIFKTFGRRWLVCTQRGLLINSTRLLKMRNQFSSLFQTVKLCAIIQ